MRTPSNLICMYIIFTATQLHNAECMSRNSGAFLELPITTDNYHYFKNTSANSIQSFSRRFPSLIAIIIVAAMGKIYFILLIKRKSIVVCKIVKSPHEGINDI